MRRRALLTVSVGLLLGTIAVYWGVWHVDFVNFDDPSYLHNSELVRQGVSIRNIGRAFVTIHLANWHPLTTIAYLVERQLFGLKNAGPYHAVNLALHLINTVLLLVVLDRMTRQLWPSAIVAALFALHPLHVESVAWISEL